MASRTATPDDIEHILVLLTEMRGSVVDALALTAQFESYFDDPQRSVMLVLDQDSTPVGMAVLNLVYKLPKIECRLDEVIVMNQARGRGYGGELIEACEDWAWQHDADAIDFTSRPSREAANGLYRKLDFELRDTNVYSKKRVK